MSYIVILRNPKWGLYAMVKADQTISEYEKESDAVDAVKDQVFLNYGWKYCVVPIDV